MDGVGLALKSSEVHKSCNAWGGEGAGGDISLLIEQEHRHTVLCLVQVVGEQIPLEAVPVAEVQISEDRINVVFPLRAEAILDQ